MRWIYYAIKYHKLGEIDDGSPIPSTTRAAVYVRDLDLPTARPERMADIRMDEANQLLPRTAIESALPHALEQIERESIQKALEACRYNKTKAAAQLGITFRALRYKLKKLEME